MTRALNQGGHRVSLTFAVAGAPVDIEPAAVIIDVLDALRPPVASG